METLTNTEQEIVVRKTFDFSVFKTMEGNRIINLQHIKRLKDSMEKNGVLCNPIIVNERGFVIDGQHRLLASKEIGSFIYYIVVKGYNLQHVHSLNMNQKNWTKMDYIKGYSELGIKPYIKLKTFIDRNQHLTVFSAIAMCSNISSGSGLFLASKYRSDSVRTGQKEVLEEGTWKGKDFRLAQEWSDKLTLIKKYYDGSYRAGFVGTMIVLFKNNNFDFDTFLKKLKINPTSLVDCANATQRIDLIEKIYNYKNRNKVSLRIL